MPTKTNRRTLLKGASLLALPAVPARPAAPVPASPAPASKYTWPVRPLMVADLRHSLDAKVQAKRVEEFLVIDDMESERGWRASAALQLSYTEERAKAGRRSLRPGTRWHEDARGSVAHAGQRSSVGGCRCPRRSSRGGGGGIRDGRPAGAPG